MNGGGITCQRQGNCRNSCHISPIRERQCIFGLTRSQSQIAGESLSHCRFGFILCRSFSLPFSQRGGCRLASQFPCLLELTCVDSGVRSVVIDEVFESRFSNYLRLFELHRSRIMLQKLNQVEARVNKRRVEVATLGLASNGFGFLKAITVQIGKKKIRITLHSSGGEL